MAGIFIKAAEEETVTPLPAEQLSISLESSSAGFFFVAKTSSSLTVLWTIFISCYVYFSEVICDRRAV